MSDELKKLDEQLEAAVTADKANLDQLEAHLGDLARVTGTFFKRLCTEGIPEAVAEGIILKWQATYWGSDYEVDFYPFEGEEDDDE